VTQTLLMNLGYAAGPAASAPATHVRRGTYARGRARVRGRHLWWLIALVRVLGG